MKNTGSYRDTFLLLFIFVFLVYSKILLNGEISFFGNDGEYYTNVARYFASGSGIVSSISIFHQGMPFFPHPTPIYPLWPILYGSFLPWFKAEIIGVWLPCVFYLFTLVAGACLCSRLASIGGKNTNKAVPVSVVFVLFMGLNPHFFFYTSIPYTEGLAYFLLMLSLWSAHKLASDLRLRNALLSGVLAGALFLCRAQMFVVFLAYLVWFILVFVRLRRFNTLMLVVAFFACQI